MKEGVKEYLLSIRDRSLGMAFGRERNQIGGPLDGAMGIFSQVMLPLTTEVINGSINYTDSPEWSKISASRAIAYACLAISGSLVAASVDTAGDLAAFIVGVNNPAAGVVLKGAINAGSYMLVDAIKHGVDHLPSFGGTAAALV